MTQLEARFPLGSTPQSDRSTRFEIWAPAAKQVHVEMLDGDQNGNLSLAGRHLMQANVDGKFQVVIPDVGAGALYRYSIDDKPGRPDPRSMFQPHGVHGPSQVVDPQAFQWSDQNWLGVAKRDLIIYELHVGSFTSQGTYPAAIDRLDQLVELGVTAVELLPLSQSPGRWNWGYDGVNYYAPRNTFGTPDQLKQFVDQCHRRGLAVINDVVYNHVGPEGNYLSEFGPYRSKKFGTPWGDALDFDQRQVRDFVIDNVLFWIDEYHLDGLRLDAVHYMFDDSTHHILDEIQTRFRQHQQGIERSIHLIGESNIYDNQLVGDVGNGRPHYDAIWSDCLMHSIYAVGASDVRLTDRQYQSTDLEEAVEHAYVFSAPKAIRVTPELRRQHHAGDQNKSYVNSLIMALQTHDSVGNHPHGKRIHQLTSLDFQQAAAPLILLYPSIPMIFMGEEDATDCPFPFFADFEDQGLRKAVDKGRRDEYPHHDWAGSPLPSDELAFKCTVVENGKSRPQMRQWYRDLLQLRKQGLAAGWLTVDNFSTAVDHQHHLYQIRYRHPEGCLNIACRIDRSDAPQLPLQHLVQDRVVLNSGHDEPTPAIGARQSIIWITPES